MDIGGDHISATRVASSYDGGAGAGDAMTGIAGANNAGEDDDAGAGAVDVGANRELGAAVAMESLAAAICS